MFVFLWAHWFIKLLLSLLLSHHISLNSCDFILFIRFLFLFPHALLEILLLGPVCGLIFAIGYESALLEELLSPPCWVKKSPCSVCCYAFAGLLSLPLCCLLLAEGSQAVQIWRLEHVAFLSTSLGPSFLGNIFPHWTHLFLIPFRPFCLEWVNLSPSKNSCHI